MIETSIQEEFHGKYWFRQNGAINHTERKNVNMLQNRIPGQLISRNNNIMRPVQYTDLTGSDFIYWSLTSRFYNKKHHNSQKLKRNIDKEINTIPLQFLSNG